MHRPGLQFEPVFDYEQVLLVSKTHALARASFVRPKQLMSEVLITYPVAIDRLDIYNYFLSPANVTPRRHKTIETTDIMVQMVASNRGVAAMPRWLAEEYASKMPVVALRLGRKGVPKKIYLGLRKTDAEVEYIRAFIDLAGKWSEQQTASIPSS